MYERNFPFPWGEIVFHEIDDFTFTNLLVYNYHFKIYTVEIPRKILPKTSLNSTVFQFGTTGSYLDGEEGGNVVLQPRNLGCMAVVHLGSHSFWAFRHQDTPWDCQLDWIRYKEGQTLREASEEWVARPRATF